MPRFEPFQAIRFADSSRWPSVIAPPYDVLSEADVCTLQAEDHNIVWIDLPHGDESRYQVAAQRLTRWLDEGVLIREDQPAFYVYRMTMTDSLGQPRQISGVLGGLEVVDRGAGGVLPHERTTAKDSTDRLELMKATGANTSPVWGLSLAQGLTAALAEPGELVGEYRVEGVTHRLEVVCSPERIAQISAIVSSDDVLIADGHHRYGVSREYRDLVRAATGREDTAAELTLTFVNELSEDQLAIDAIHRLYRGVGYDQLKDDLAPCFTFEAVGVVPTPATLAEMVHLGRLVLVGPDGRAEWLIPKPGAFDQVRALDGAWLEHALQNSRAQVSYQHGLAEILDIMSSPADDHPGAAVLIRPTSITEIIRTARQGELMPPKSTFFTPKLRTGLVIRPTTALGG